MRYSVILREPDYLSSEQITLLWHVTAANPAAAIAAAQVDAAACRDVEEPDDFLPLFVFSGHLKEHPIP